MRRSDMRAAALLPLLVLLGACAREERSLTARAFFTIERVPAGVTGLEMEGRVHDMQLSAADFDRAWSAVTRGAAVGGLAVTLGSVHLPDGSPTNLLAGLTLVVPTPLRAGTRVTAAHTLPAPPSMPMYWSTWGPHPLRDDAGAEVALRAFDYRAVGMVIENDFVADTVTGSIDVVSTVGDQVVLRLDLTFGDVAARIVRVRGDITITAERYRPPIT